MKLFSMSAGELNPTGELAEAINRRHAEKRRFALALLGLGLALVLSVVLGTGIGRMEVGWGTITAVLLNKLGLPAASVDRTTEVVIWGIRLSRVVLSGLVGAALAVAGVVFQGLLLNPLADPFTLGVSTGGAFGVALLVMLGVGGSVLGLSPLPLGALAGALGAMATVLVLSREAGRLRKESLILAGIVVSTFLSALISLIKSLDEESLSAIVFWIMGSFSGRGWIHVGFLLPYVAAGLALAAYHSRELDILALGEEQSHFLGVSVSRVRLKLLLGASLLTAGAVAVSGVIGFVGLVVPHLCRLLAGPSHGRLMVLSALTGALLLIWADVLARVLLASGQELPVGVVTALLGGPFFFYLLKSRRARGMW
jgi:iron complex transport system permease protein